MTSALDHTAASAAIRPPASLASNFAATFAGNVVYAGCQWAMLVLLAKVGSPAMVGEFALALALTAPVMIQANLNLRAALATDVGGEFAFREYLTIRLWTTALALGAIVIAVLWIGYRPEARWTIFGIALAKGIESASDIFYGLLQRAERMDRVAISLGTKGILSVAALSAGLWIGHSLRGGVIGMVLAWAAVLAFYDVPCTAGMWGRRSRVRLRRLWDLGCGSLPLGFALAATSLSASAPRLFLERNSGVHALGVFSAMSYLVVAGTTVVTALGQSATPRLAGYWLAGNRPAFLGLLTKLGAGAGLAGAAAAGLAALAGGRILTLLYGPEYASENRVFVLVMAAAAVGYVGSVIGYGVTATRSFRRLVVPYAVVALASILASAILVPRYGLTGAALASLVVGIATCAAPFFIFRLPNRAKFSGGPPNGTAYAAHR